MTLGVLSGTCRRARRVGSRSWIGIAGSSLLAALLVTTFGPGPARATKLTFDIQQGGNPQLGVLVPHYGSFANGSLASPVNGLSYLYGTTASGWTPDVRVEFHHRHTSGSGGLGDAANIVDGGFGALTPAPGVNRCAQNRWSGFYLEIRFIPTGPHASVKIESFKVAGSGAGQDNQFLRILEYNFLGQDSLKWNAAPGSGTLRIGPDPVEYAPPNVVGLPGQTLSIQIGPSTGVAIDDISFSQITSGPQPSYLGPAPRPNDILKEAEQFEIGAGTGSWSLSTSRKWVSITDDALGGQYLVAPRSGTSRAVVEVNFPQSGDYRLWTRYVNRPAKRAPFSVEVTRVADGDPVAQYAFDSQYVTPHIAHARPYSNWEFLIQHPVNPTSPVYEWATYDNWEWVKMPTDLAIECPPAPATCTHTVAIVPPSTSDPEAVNALIDAVALIPVTAADETHHPAAVDYAAPLYARFRVHSLDAPPRHRGLFYLSAEHHSLHAVTDRRFYSTPGKQFFENSAETVDALEAGKSSRWINLNPALWWADETWLELDLSMGPGRTMPTDSSWTIDLSTTPDESGLIDSWSRQGPGGGLVMHLDRRNPAQQVIESNVQLSESNLAAAQAASALGRQPTQFPIVTGIEYDRTRTPHVVVENDLDAVVTLGFSGTHDSLEDQGVLMSKGLDFEVRSCGVGANQDYSTRDVSSWANQQLCQQIPPRWAAGGTTIAMIRTGEEVAVPPVCGSSPQCATPSVKSSPQAPNDYAYYLSQVCPSRGLTPGDLSPGATVWSDVPLVDAFTPAPDTPAQKPKAYYFSQRFRFQWYADYHAWATGVLEGMFPGVRTGANTRPDLGANRNMLFGVDWYAMYRNNAWTHGFWEDGGTEWSDQIVGYAFDVMRSACKYRNQPLGTFVHWTRPGADMAAKGFSEVGRGAKLLDFFTYGPRHTRDGASDAASERRDWYAGVKAFNYAVGAAEEHLLRAMPPPSKVAFLYSNTSDIWDLYNARLHQLAPPVANEFAGAEQHGLYLLFRHMGYPLDVLSEDDVLEGRAAPYELVIVTGRYIKSGVMEQLLGWANNGGTLYIGPGAATFDEFNQLLPVAVTNHYPRGPFNFIEVPGAFGYDTLSVRRQVASNNQVLNVVSAHQELVPNGGTVLATFTSSPPNGAPAAVSYPKGTNGGRILSVGFPIGVDYPNQGISEYWDYLAAHPELNPRLNPMSSLRSYSPSYYPASHRTAMSAWLASTGIQPTVTVSDPLVEGSLLLEPNGDAVVVLSNWTGYAGGPRQDTVVTVNLPGGGGTPWAAGGTIGNVAHGPDQLTFTTTVEYGHFVVIPRAGSTVLTFTSNYAAGWSANLITDPGAASYGDNVSSASGDADPTTNHTYGGSAPYSSHTGVSYAQPPGGNFALYQTGGDWGGGVAFLAGSAGPFDVVFTPEPGYAVSVVSFVLDDYDGFAVGHTVDWQLLDASDAVLTSGIATVAADQELTVNTGYGYHRGPLKLRLLHSAGNLADLAIDSIQFDERPAPSGITELTFQSNYVAGGSASLVTDPKAASYGDAVSSATSDVDATTHHAYGGSGSYSAHTFVDYAKPAGGNFFLYQTGGDWSGGVAFFSSSPEPFEITFTPQPGYRVRLLSFVLDDYDGYQSGHTVTWSLLDASNAVLASGMATVAPDQELTVNTQYVLEVGPGSIKLRLEHTAGHTADLAIDSIRFEEIPE
jgi:hypothetical protein